MGIRCTFPSGNLLDSACKWCSCPQVVQRYAPKPASVRTVTQAITCTPGAKINKTLGVINAHHPSLRLCGKCEYLPLKMMGPLDGIDCVFVGTTEPKAKSWRHM